MLAASDVSPAVLRNLEAGVCRGVIKLYRLEADRTKLGSCIGLRACTAVGVPEPEPQRSGKRTGGSSFASAVLSVLDEGSAADEQDTSLRSGKEIRNGQ